MARLRQYLANRYASVEATNSEFENIIRYINAAEVGNLTLGELMEKLFNADGTLDLDLAFRYNAATGLEVKIDPATDNWTLLAPAADLRGATGANFGAVEAPLFFNRVDVTATAGQTVFDYTIVAEAADVLVWKNGVLQSSAAYTYNRTTSQVTLASGAAAGDLVSLVSIRTNPAIAYRRVDITAAAGQAVFPFPHSELEEIAVFRNGVFQREGGGYDYVKYWQTDTVTMTVSQSAGTLITILCITNSGVREVAGLMLEDRYTDGAGAIRLDRIAIADGALAQAKVAGLAADLGAKASIYLGPSTPTAPTNGALWINTSYSVPALMFYDGVRWLSASPNGLIPLPQAANALQYLRLNSTANALEYAALDLSGLIATSQRGAANGVAPLDNAGLLPSGVIPAWAARAPIVGRIGGALANGTYTIGVIEDQYSFDGLTAVLGVGSATLQLQVGGVNVGGTLAAGVGISKLAITPSTKDGNAAPLAVTLVVSGASADAANLAFNVGALIVG